MNILVTGATGFIGQHLVRYLATGKHTVSVLVRPESNTDAFSKDIHILTTPNEYASIQEIFKAGNFDGVIHLATYYTAKHGPEDVKKLIESNVAFGSMIIEAASNSNVPWFINTETFTQYNEDGKYSPSNLYSASKQAFNDVVRYYAENSDITILNIILFNTFGAGDTRKKIFNLWKTAIETGVTVDMSPGKQIMDITHVDNVVDGYGKAVELLRKNDGRQLNGKFFTLPSNERMTLVELSKLFSDTLGKPLKINFGATPYRENEIMNPLQGTPLTDWKPTISLRDGIKRTFTE